MNNLKEKEKIEINIDLDIDVEIEIPEDVELILWNSDYVPFEVVAAALLNRYTSITSDNCDGSSKRESSYRIISERDRSNIRR